MARHRWPLVAHHTDVRLIAGGPLATLFDSIGSSVVIQWQMPPSDCLLRVLPLIAGGPLEIMAVVSGQRSKLLVCIQQISHQAMRR